LTVEKGSGFFQFTCKNLDMTLPQPQLQVLICQNRTCLQQGSALVAAAFLTWQNSDWQTIKSGCLGQCGNGPMVLILPEMIWYSRVQPEQVAAIVERHLGRGHSG
jgi:(2Fe-2S) ferredoxin